ncbi:MAG TPA: metallopeptidase TldD-related protein [Actinomycetota bacterium]|nr:metallopeptidase TldD-related protein [Actinomycetota bacterium]
MNPTDIVSAALTELTEGCTVLHTSHTQNLRWANSAVTTNGDTQTSSLTVIAFEAVPGGTAVGVATGQVQDSGEAAALAAGARSSARAADAYPAVAPLVPGRAGEDFAQPGPAIDESSTDALLGAVSSFLARPPGRFGYAEVDRTTTHLATTSGTGYRHVQDSVRIEASARDGRGSTWWGTNSLAADFGAAASAGAELLALQGERIDLSPGRHRVILSPAAVADLLIYLAWSANGRDAVEGHNVFSRRGGGTRLGDRLSPRHLDLYADPLHPGLQTATRVVATADSSTESVFDNGVELRRTHLIRDGHLSALRASRPTADRFGLEPVHMADNLILTDADGHGELADLVARTDEAILINCLWYIREVDPQNLLLTGLTRDGVYAVRDGRLTGAGPNFRFNVSVPDILGRIMDATATSPCLPREWADWFPRAAMPALLIDGFHLSSPSEAL